MVLLLLLVACAAKEGSKKASYRLMTMSTAGYGEEFRNDPGQIGKLFSVPESVYSDPELNEMPKGWLGIVMKAPSGKISLPDYEESVRAIEVTRVFPSSPADRAGMLQGDFIFQADAKRFEETTWDDRVSSFRKFVLEKGPGTRTDLMLLRDGKILKIPVVLGEKPLTAVKFSHDVQGLDGREANEGSLVYYALKKEKLVKDYARTSMAIRRGAAEVISPLVQRGGYNPFRLTVVNRALYYPFNLPSLAKEISENLHRHFNGRHKDLAGLIQAGQEALNIQAPLSRLAPARVEGPSGSLTTFVTNFVEAVSRARAMRQVALSRLSSEAVETLYQEAGFMLVGDPEEGNKERSDEQKKQDEEKLAQFIEILLKVDLKLLIRSSLEIAYLLDEKTLAGIRGLDLDDWDLPGSWKVSREKGTITIVTREGTVQIGGYGNNKYEENVMLILDLGGDDRYLNQAGASTREIPFSAVVDLSGNDTYVASSDFAQGAGVLGAGFLYDLKGDDSYIAKNYSQGSGFMGVGLLVDTAGMDLYESIAASQGSGAWGIGILAEGEGDDMYSAARYAQGFGFVYGYGSIVEVSGNDFYFAGGLFPDYRDPENSYQSLSQGFGFGLRPDQLVGTSGGIGVIADAQGDDNYVADYFSQGASYWYALGILSDKEGNDRYTAGRYSQGAGVHLAAGILIDDEGDDSYSVSYGVSQGLGHDLSTGFLLDNGGDDHYQCGVLCQGAGNDNGIGVLNDNGGDDVYQVDGKGQGQGNYLPVRDLGSFGFHFDTGGGADRYTTPRENNTLIYRTQWGIFLDTR